MYDLAWRRTPRGRACQARYNAKRVRPSECMPRPTMVDIERDQIMVRVIMLTRGGHSAREIAQRIGLSDRSVQRWRARYRAQSERV